MKRNFALLSLLSALSLQSATLNVTSSSDNPADANSLPYYILHSNTGDTIDCKGVVSKVITLTRPLPPILHDLTITTTDGTLLTIQASGFQAFSIASGDISLQNIVITGGVSQGGAGGSGYGGGGGGAGGGGALYLHEGSKTSLNNVQLTSNRAIGGAGGTGTGSSGGGGGGGGYSGGIGGPNGILGGGGGGGGNSQAVDLNTGAGGDGTGGVGGAGEGSDFFVGAGGGGANSSGGAAAKTIPNPPVPNPINPSAGGGANSGSGGGGGGAGGVGNPGSTTGGGAGGEGLGTNNGFGGGGGGGSAATQTGGVGIGTGGGGGGGNVGGAGGDYGGGGGGGDITGGNGGFGAGGGGGKTTAGTSLALGGLGGTGATPAGGGGAGLGGAVFVQKGATLTIGDSGGSVILGSNSTTGGTGANVGASLSDDIFLRSGGSLVFNLTNSPLTISSNIESDQGVGGGTGGGLTLQGTKTLTLTGVNTYTGGTTLSGGTLKISSDSALGVVPSPAVVSLTIGPATLQAGGIINSNRLISLTDAATIDTGTFNVTFSDVISGAGSLTKIGTGILSLSNPNPNTYSGGTTITKGILNINGDAVLGDSSGSLSIDAATLQAATSFTSARAINLSAAKSPGATIDTQGNAVTLSGVISGSGFLTVAGTAGGALTLTGANTYSGGTAINANATLQGNATSLQGAIQNSGLLVFDQANDGTYSGNLSGSGQLTKQGTGALELTGTSPFSGATSVTAGTLTVNGQFPNSTVTIFSGATLSGSGTVGPTINQGQLSPGNGGTGTLTINGNLSLSPTSSLNVDITPASVGLVNVNGTAILSGPVILQSGTPGFYGLKASYTILTATNPITTSFASVHSLDANFLPSLSYTQKSVLLSVKILEPFLYFPFYNRNTKSIGQNIDALSATGVITNDLTNVIDSLAGKSTLAINQALDQMHPAQYGAFTEIQATMSSQLISRFHRQPHIGCGSNCGSWRVWTEGIGNWLEEKSHGSKFADSGSLVKIPGEQVNFTAKTGGVAFGGDKEFYDNLSVGFGGAWDQTHLKWHHGRGYGEVNGFYGSVYTDYQLDNFYLGVSLLAGVDFHKAVRRINFSTIDRQAKGKYRSLDVAAQFCSAYFFGSPYLLLYPYANLDYFYFNNDGFTETEANGLNLTVQGNQNSALRPELGFAFQVKDTNYGETMCISPLFSFGWAMIYPIHRHRFEAHFADAPISFKAEGRHRTWQLFTLDFGLNLSYKCYTLGLEYDVELSPDQHKSYFVQRADARLEWRW